MLSSGGGGGASAAAEATRLSSRRIVEDQQQKVAPNSPGELQADDGSSRSKPQRATEEHKTSVIARSPVVRPQQHHRTTTRQMRSLQKNPSISLSERVIEPSVAASPAGAHRDSVRLHLTRSSLDLSQKPTKTIQSVQSAQSIFLP